MGPITLFDKSFLQSLSLDESVWFDNFFLPSVSPFFFVETLADLEKPARQGLTPEQEVARIADKFPEMNGMPCAHHQTLVRANLLGHPIPMTGQIVVPGGRPVRSGDETGIVYDRSQEAEAFSRWHQREFKQLERQFAREWRESMASIDLVEVARLFSLVGIDGRSCQTLEEARRLAVTVTARQASASDPLALSLIFLGADAELRREVRQRHRSLGFPSLSAFAPYASYVLTIEVFFQLAVVAGLIPSKPSSRVDIAYLFYLPFCMLFVSSDRLHERCAPLFVRSDQHFLWGPDLKDGLQQLNRHYMALPDAVKESGVMRFAHWPPTDTTFLVTRIFDQHFPHWRDRIASSRPRVDPEKEKQLVEHLKRLSEAPTVPAEKLAFDPKDFRFRSMRRMVREKKGSWYQVPKDLQR